MCDFHYYIKINKTLLFYLYGLTKLSFKKYAKIQIYFNEYEQFKGN